MLLPIHGVLNSAELDEFQKTLAAQSWIDGKLSAGGQAALAKTNLQLDNTNPVTQQLAQRIIAKLSANPLFVSAALPKKIFPPNFNCYREGGHYGLHVDNAILHRSNNEVMRTDLSATLFFSEPESYSGGELCIETQYGAQQVKLAAGALILYPSTSLHQVLPVTSGERVAAFFWIESLVRDNNHREMLFDLDQSIQRLTVQQSDEVNQLTSIYHNLIRNWADS